MRPRGERVCGEKGKRKGGGTGFSINSSETYFAIV